SHEGPYMVHCVEGKDRTGFVMMVLETLAGATYNQIIDDYMITYDNYYGINKTKDLNKYNVIKGKNIDVMLSTLIGDSSVDITTANYANECEEYLRAGGLSASEITQLKARLLK
ncbi:MAG: tyrosine-protein phosphatase, partial [Bacilli bacterium]|nr:tyrosine-protein phosphatase [Bacilli bacterium]